MNDQALDNIDLFGTEETDVEETDVEETDVEETDVEETDVEETDAEENDAEDSGEDITTITQLADEFGVEPSALYNLQVPMGEGIEPVSLSAMKDAYQDNIRNKESIEQERNALEQERIEFKNSKLIDSDKSNELDSQVVSAESELQQINSTYNSIDWALFEQENPGEAALQKQKFQEAFNQALVKKDSAVQLAAAKKEQAKAEYHAEQVKQLKTLIPEWNNSETYNNDRVAIRSMLNEYGFSEQDIQGLTDAKSIKLINDFAKLKTRISNAKPTGKKETSAVLKTGTFRRAAKSKNADVNKMVTQAANSKDKSVKAAAVAKLLNGI